jgi:predicted esterase
MREHHIIVGRTARYLLLGPEADPSAIREIWLVLHGYGQLATTFVRTFEPLDDGSRLIVAPEALNRFYLVDVSSGPAADRPVGATWMTREDREREIDDYVAYLDRLWKHLVVRLPEPTPARLTVLGFSQGTATAARWVALGAVQPSHLVLWGGLLPPDLPLDTPDHPLRRPRVHLVVGSRDGFITEARLTEESARLEAVGITYDVVRYSGGHGIKRDTLEALARRIGERNED